MYKEEGSNWELSSCSYEVEIVSDSLDTFYDGFTDLVVEGIEVGIAYVGFSKAFDCLSYCANWQTDEMQTR